MPQYRHAAGAVRVRARLLLCLRGCVALPRGLRGAEDVAEEVRGRLRDGQLDQLQHQGMGSTEITLMKFVYRVSHLLVDLARFDLDFECYCCRPDSAWDDRNLAEVAGQLGKKVEDPNKCQPNPGP